MKSNNPENDKDIVFSRSIKAGKRIYYVDVKRNRKEELYLSITESKKIVSGEMESPQVNFEKHKIFLYREDFEKFQNGLAEAIEYILNEQGPAEPRPDNTECEDIKIDIDF
ncbi:MAG: PUR family DNA/RNA-binding protein [Paraprevotella sp.]|nr:PUR family DNA/RNA-binding protein [Paraprevotella sp.]